MINQALFSTGKNDWETPQWLFDDLNEEFHFMLDPCAYHETAKCNKYYTKKEDGLIQNWGKEIVFCNPPYSNIEQTQWIKKGYEHSKKGGIAVMLIPSRTDTKRFHDCILGKAEIRLSPNKGSFSFLKNIA